MVKAGSRDFAVSADWTPATGDVKLSKDGGAQANIGTLPSYSNGQWIFQLTGTEMTAKRIVIAVVDSATKAVDDQMVIIETYGHTSALHPYLDGTLLIDDGTAAFDRTTDSLQAIRDRGDSAWQAEPGLTADEIGDDIAARTLTATLAAPLDTGAFTSELLADIQSGLATDADAKTLLKFVRNRVTVDASGNIVVMDNDGTTPLYTFAADDDGTTLDIAAGV